MHPGLVADLHRNRQVREQFRAGSDHDVFGLPRQVGRIMVDQVVVLDPRAGRTFAEDIPHRLVQAARGQVPPR
jgi:hypothetical protein